MFLRDTLSVPHTFDEVITILNTTRLVAPVYLIVSGVNSGACACVIPRARCACCVDMRVVVHLLSHSPAHECTLPDCLSTDR